MIQLDIIKLDRSKQHTKCGMRQQKFEEIENQRNIYRVIGQIIVNRNDEIFAWCIHQDWALLAIVTQTRFPTLDGAFIIRNIILLILLESLQNHSNCWSLGISAN